jgi:hypothetical protein
MPSGLQSVKIAGVGRIRLIIPEWRIGQKTQLAKRVTKQLAAQCLKSVLETHQGARVTCWCNTITPTLLPLLTNYVWYMWVV